MDTLTIIIRTICVIILFIIAILECIKIKKYHDIIVQLNNEIYELKRERSTSENDKDK